MMIKNRVFRKKLSSILAATIFLVFLYNCSSSESSNRDDEIEIIDDTEEVKTMDTIVLNIRVHIMKDIIMTHPTGQIMTSWVTPANVTEIIVLEVNKIWEQAGIVWNIESIIEENVVKSDTYNESLVFLANTKRDSQGRSDPARLPHLFSLMQPKYLSTESQLGKNLFHIYLFPFIGNTSQGNAMSSYNYHSVLGTWTNKHNGGGVPEKTLLTEVQYSFNRGSLSRTISHEIGHVLNLSHKECADSCLMGGTNSDGYLLTEGQIITARIEALGRSFD
ncbi:MAG: hypothetical protein ACJAYY_000838 [Paraglaciecola sp.]|jgi:hypothetical protein